MRHGLSKSAMAAILVLLHTILLPKSNVLPTTFDKVFEKFIFNFLATSMYYIRTVLNGSLLLLYSMQLVTVRKDLLKVQRCFDRLLFV